MVRAPPVDGAAHALVEGDLGPPAQHLAGTAIVQGERGLDGRPGGIVLDAQKNAANPREGLISADTSKVKIAVIPTNEEFVVATEVQRLLETRF